MSQPNALNCAAACATAVAAVLASAPLDTSAQRPTQPQRTAARVSEPGRARFITTVEGISEYTLSNGLRVLLVPDQTKPTVTVNITYLVGSRHEGYGEAGMAHLVEHLVFKGTPRHPNIPQELTARGSRPNGTTWYDRTNYFEVLPASDANLEWALDLEADRMVNSFVARKDLRSEFSVVRNEFEARDNIPWLAVLERTMATAFLWHGYGRSTIGSRSDIENVPIERLQAFYRKYYQPDNAVLVVAGKFEPQRTLRLIEQKFGTIPRPRRSIEAGNLLFETYTVEPTQDGERTVVVRRVGDAQLLVAAYHVPAGSHPDFAAVDVLTRALGDNPSGRIYKALVDTKLAAAANAFNYQLREPGVLIAEATLRMDQNLDSARAALERTLDAAASTPFTAQEVDRGKTQILKNIDLLLNNSAQVGFALTEWAARGDWRLLFLHRDRVERVTAADVSRVAAAFLKPANRTVGLFIPVSQPERAEIPGVPDVTAMTATYQGRAGLDAGEAFDPSPRNIEARITRLQLPVGAHMALLPKQNRGDRVVAQITLRHGTAESLMGKVAVAELTADMLSRGTQQLTRQQVQDSLDKLKARVFISGSTNSTVAYMETVRDRLLPTLDLVVQQLRAPRFDSAEFQKLKLERIAQLEEFKSQPGFLGSIALNRRLNPFPKGHILHVATPDEQIGDLSAATVEDVRRFHRDYYGASDADIAVVGDFAADSVRLALWRSIGDWRPLQPFARIVRTYIPTQASEERIETPDKENAVFYAGHNIALRDDDPDYPALIMANRLLGGGFLNSRLAVRLRQRDGVSYGVGSNVTAQALDRTGVFQVSAIYAPQNVERVVAAVREEIERVKRDGFTVQELTEGKPGFVQQRLHSRANDEELVGILIARRFAGRTMSYDEDLEAKLNALTLDQVNAAFRKYINLSSVAVVRAGDFARRRAATATP